MKYICILPCCKNYNTLNIENHKFELFVAFKDTSNKYWLPPVKLSSEINNGDFNYRPFITFDGKYLFFTRRKGDEIKIYWVKTEIITAD